MRQLIIARKDLNMSAGKFAAQCCHASLAYFAHLITDNAARELDDGYELCSAVSYLGDKETYRIYKNADLCRWSKETFERGEKYFYYKIPPIELVAEKDVKYHYDSDIKIERTMMEDWFNGTFTKTICEAKNKTQLLKAKTIAEEMGMVEGEDFFLIRDACFTELTPEEYDENGQGNVLTCIGFKPLPDDTAHQISRKFQLYK